MGKEAPPAASPTSQPPRKAHKKLPRLPPNQKISKRPLLHPHIAAPRTGSSTTKIVYVSSSSPFISVVKRVRKLLSHIETRAAGNIDLKGSHREVFKAINDGVERARGSGEKDAASIGGKNRSKGRGEQVMLKATGKAIEKLLRLAVYFQGEEDLCVELKTGSVGAVDDIVEIAEGVDGGNEETVESMEVGSRVRRASVLEVGVWLR